MAERIEPFKDWIVEEVLPSIRETGSYVAPNAVAPQPVDPLAFLEDPAILRGLLGRHTVSSSRSARDVWWQRPRVEASRPVVAFFDALADSDGLQGLRAASRALFHEPNLFITRLRDRGISSTSRRSRGQGDPGQARDLPCRLGDVRGQAEADDEAHRQGDRVLRLPVPSKQALLPGS
ncbi:hypothetical protein MKK64_23750 [Methylobacterium sp. E-025]|uniref:hypothetical protein n=1 Tax=Methylobacterium sp. E-025 TaxID=2836561 RepID=UPI001FBBC988|nr:hypothetical protein [Methylobacterium sp. E-025]MCJ2114187.1 hypothetical protein [Methylobacterium sp. E-025]